MTDEIRHDWTAEEVEELYRLPLTELLFLAQTVHRRHHDPVAVQRCTLLSVKTGGCPEDCTYCSQSARHGAKVPREPLMSVGDVRDAARRAKAAGATRFCMGAAWREVRAGDGFEDVLEMVRAVADLDMEVCTTLGMLTLEQARRLKDAGLTVYNHNLDTSPGFYGSVVTTHTYEDRLATLACVAEAGLKVCCGGIVGMGEAAGDRCALLAQLGRLQPHPESVPINLLVRMPGTPLADAEELDPFDLVRTVACARIVTPRARVRLSAGRASLTDCAQALCFAAGANSIFSGEKLLTSPNRSVDEDDALMARLGLRFA